jgi:hypothetical protein
LKGERKQGKTMTDMTITYTTNKIITKLTKSQNHMHPEFISNYENKIMKKVNITMRDAFKLIPANANLCL